MCHLAELQQLGLIAQILIVIKIILWPPSRWQCQHYNGDNLISVTILIFAAWTPKCAIKLFVASSRASGFMLKILIKLQNPFCDHCKAGSISFTVFKACFFITIFVFALWGKKCSNSARWQILRVTIFSVPFFYVSPKYYLRANQMS